MGRLGKVHSPQSAVHSLQSAVGREGEAGKTGQAGETGEIQLAIMNPNTGFRKNPKPIQVFSLQSP